MGAFVKLAFAKTAFSYLEQQLPGLDMASYRRRVLAEYKAIVARTPSVGTMRDNMFVMTMYAGAFFITLYKTEPDLLTPEVIQGLVRGLVLPAHAYGQGGQERLHGEGGADAHRPGRLVT